VFLIDMDCGTSCTVLRRIARFRRLQARGCRFGFEPLRAGGEEARCVGSGECCGTVRKVNDNGLELLTFSRKPFSGH
jgi:hypothetical protein